MDAAKERFTAHMQKEMENFGKMPVETQKKMEELMGDAAFATEKVELNKKYFVEADKNNDGMLDKDELKVYQGLWESYLKAKCGEFEIDAELNAAAFEAFRISGKEGVTEDDLKQVMVWEEELMANMA
mmetsp:Transcript_37125/g.27035  ORF Transcript_37125/g.27035 Transcript_37125/m.27035 type:complete len:128 (-) Transcript_37125:71-454(-)|eukprot:CAMPEP_0116877124 /NCGR_PEP_ID=MMETSP0463-20121206/8946_1 /TAXON_ID=181622 /ORGANISM="Strombidinopsis sp, Strain SopsisLIS2011" /LENGTH=127 /DNA_ID=CAMNT_0004524175 /DNA_START=27 /DNA_END=410 /DNA_ORIENTATION=+